MAAYTYDGNTGDGILYFDGVQVASASGAPATVQLGSVVGADEGPWNVGTNYAAGNAGMRGVVYAARVYDNVKSSAWVRQAWKDANGWS